MNTQQLEALTLHLERTIRAPRERVFDAWSNNEDMQQWSAPEGMSIPEGSMDFRVGGHYRAVIVEQDGTRHVVTGTYREINRPSRLVYSHTFLSDDNGSGNEATPSTIVTVEFHESNGATRIVLTQEGFTSEGDRDGHKEGWSSSFNKLASLLE